MSRIVISFDAPSRSAFGTPVPVEIYNEHLTQVADPIVHLSTDHAVEVPGPGLYYVRATLPSGENLSATVRVTGETADVPLRLEAEERSPRETLAWAYVNKSVKQASGMPRHALREQRELFNAESLGPLQRGGGAMTTLQRGSRGPDVTTLQETLKARGFDPGQIDSDFGGGTEAAVIAFQKSEGLLSDGIAGPWTLARLGLAGPQDAPSAVPAFLPPSPQVEVTGLFRMTPLLDAWTLTPFTDAALSDDDPSVAAQDDRLLRQMRLERYIPSDIEELWFPVYLHCRFRLSPNEPERDCLFAIPPSRHARILLVRADTDPMTDANVRALVDADRPSAEALLGYLEQGAVKAARRIAPDVINQAISLLGGKREDPLSAVIAGYFLLRASRLERQSWMENLANWFTTLPDGAIIYGASLLRGEDALPEWREKARHYLLEAVKRGIPAYTIGLRLLFDSLRQVAMYFEQDDTLRTALAKVRAVAAYTDWETTTTAFAVPPPSRGLPFVLQTAD